MVIKNHDLGVFSLREKLHATFFVGEHLCVLPLVKFCDVLTPAFFWAINSDCFFRKKFAFAILYKIPNMFQFQADTQVRSSLRLNVGVEISNRTQSFFYTAGAHIGAPLQQFCVSVPFYETNGFRFF